MDIQTQPLITLSSDAPARSQSSAADSLETAFLIPGFRGLWLDASGWSNKATGFFAFEVKREPQNLKNHVQRVLHHISLNDPEQVSGALIDLFIVLQQSGQALKRRLLNYARQTLGEEQYHHFLQLTQSTPKPGQFPESSYSVLSQGVSKLRPLIELAAASATTPPKETIETAQTLSASHNGHQQQKLETAILQGSGDYLIHTDLIELYKTAEDKSSFLKFFSKMDIQEQGLLDLWREAYDYFDNQAES